MSRFRPILFWTHLAAGVICGLVIAVLCFTGTAIAFEKELIAWAERDARRITPAEPTGSKLDVEAMSARVQTAYPEAKFTTIVLNRDPSIATVFQAGRTDGYYVNQTTGEVRRPASTSMRKFMQTMVEWHRYLGLSGEKSRPKGKLVTGIANLAFCFLALTGLFLWWPRSLSWRAFRPSIWFTQNATSRARDWNWHNTVGFWCAPIFIGLTLTALPISFRWAAELTYTLTGTPLPASGPQSSGAPPSSATVPIPAPVTAPVSRELLLISAQRQFPEWQSLSFSFAHKPDPAKPQPWSVTAREKNSWPRTATTTLHFDPFTGNLLRQDGYEQLPAARQLRVWTRYLHTGEALGPWAQFVAGLACLGGLFLVYTGFALSWRRFFPKRERPIQPA